MYQDRNGEQDARATEDMRDTPKPPHPPLPPKPTGPRKLSDVIYDATAEGPKHMSVGDLMAKLSAQGLAPVILFFGILNTMAFIPGSSAITGFPVILMGLAVMFGYKGIWLPQRIRDFTFEREKLHMGVEKASPWLKKLERYVHPRLWPVYGFVPDFLYGLAVVLLAIIITLPIPGANFVPAVSIICLSVGFASRDGIWVMAGLFMATLAVGIVLGAAFAALHGAGRMFAG